MALTLNPATKVFTILQADLTFVSGVLYEFDTNAFRKEAFDLLSSEAYIWMPDAYDHNGEYTVLGVTYARKVEFINGFSIQFEDTGGAYAVRFIGSNNNLFDLEGGILLSTPLVTVAGQNSAGLINLPAIDVMGPKVDDIHGQVQREVFIDTEALSNGTAGYQQAPFDNFTDGVDYAEANALLHLALKDDATVDRQLRNFEIRGLNFPDLDLNGQDMNMSTVRNCNISGSHLGQLLAEDIGLSNVASGEILAQRVGISGTYGLRDGAFSVISDVSILTPATPFVIDLVSGAAGSTAAFLRVSGHVSIINCDHADDVVHVHMSAGTVTIDASCSAGNIVICGSVNLTDNSTGATVDISTMEEEIIFKRMMENGETFEVQQRLQRAAAAGIIVQLVDGSYRIRDAADSKDRIVGDDSANSGRDISSTDGT